MKMTSDLEKELEVFIQQRKEELFRDKVILSKDEEDLLKEYIHDYNNPEWRTVIIDKISFPDYEVSSIGSIRNKYKKTELSQNKLNGGYLIVNIAGKYKALVHRLVAQSFIPNPENKKEVNHINGIKTCNWYKNLEWATRQENANHALETGLINIGENVPTAKYTEEDVHNVCKLAEQGMGAEKISKTLNVSKSFVVGIMYRGEWRHISSQYKMPQAKKFHDENVIHEICKLLSKGKRPVEIANELSNLNVKWEDVQSIRKGKSWRRISNQYDIPGLEKNNITEERSSDKIRELLKQGIMDTDVIANKLGIEKTRAKKQYIMKVRRNYLRSLDQDETSTTISKESTSQV